MDSKVGKSWSEKLECPIDEDAEYDNTYVRTSNHGLSSHL